jgi:hypothetical protein
MSLLQRSKSVVVEVCVEIAATWKVSLFSAFVRIVLTSKEFGQHSTDFFPYFSFRDILGSLAYSGTMQGNFALIDEG